MSANFVDSSSVLRESVLGKPSYSGTDIRVYARLYDGGDYIKNAINEIESVFPVIPTGNDQLDLQVNSTLQARLDVLEGIYTSTQGALSLIELSEMQTISWSIHREKYPVRACGANYVRGYCRGPRSVAGSMIFTVFNEHVLTKLMQAGSQRSDGDLFRLSTTTLADQLPPIDIQIFFANEFGDTSFQVIYGVEFINEGQTMSIEDLLLESVFQYVAQDIDPMRKLSDGRIVDARNVVAGSDNLTTKASELLYDRNVKDYLTRNNPFDFILRSQ